MFIFRILIIIFVISYFIWLINNRILGKNIALARVIAAVLLISGITSVFLISLSYLLE